jgi:glycolate oxidase
MGRAIWPVLKAKGEVSMSLPEHIYGMFESVVGSENISDRPHVLAAYRHTSPQDVRKPANPDAVILPGSTEEVQAIVRICRRYDIKYNPVTSLLSVGMPPGKQMKVILSLRRMNRILEINEEDRYAVVEPAVRHVQLKPELMKRGLSYPVPSVGPSCSVMANFLGKGEHHIQYSTSKNNRYLLGYEWVMPTGEILRAGSLGGDSGWFCPDGPGPSLAGLVQKGYGVFTKVAIALDAWKGPAAMPTEGRSPSYKMRLPQDCHKVFIFKFPTLDKARDAMVEMGRAEIGVAVLKFFYATAAVMFTVSANDFWELWKSGLFQKELPQAVWVYLATWSPEEMAYEERVLWDIVREMGGEEVDQSIRNLWENNMDFFIIVSFLQRVLKLGGGWAPVIHTESLPHTFQIAKTIPEFLNEFIEKGLILDAPHNFQIIPIEYAHGAHIEFLFFYDRTSPEAHRIPIELMKKSMETDIKHGYFAPAAEAGKLYGNFDLWAAKIKEAF